MRLIAGLLLVLKLLWAAIGWLVSWAFITFFAVLAVVATVSLGPRFGIMVMVVAPLVAFLLAVLTTQGKPSRSSLVDSWSKRHKRKFLLVSVFVLFLILGVAISPTISDHRSRPHDAEAALQSFVPNCASDVDQARLERTLAEFERARRRLAKLWLVPESSPRISLCLFRDAGEHKAYTLEKWGFDWAAGHASCLKDGVVVGVPLEDAPNVLEELPVSGTLSHEMVHATWCQKLGQDSFFSIPTWFHEGMANRYGYEGTHHFFERAWNRPMVWLSRADLLPPTQFCGYQIRARGDRAEIGLFYGTSWEFIRSLEASHGIQNLNAVVNDVGAGMDFEDSLSHRLGGICSELYGEWSQSL